MTVVSRRFLLLAAAWLLPGCSAPETPLAKLELAVVSLQEALEARSTSDVMRQLDERFRAQDELDADWARKTMMLMFLRYAQVRIVAVSSRSRLEDGEGGTLGLTEAQVLVTGAQGLIPERLAPYTVTLRWRREGDDWKLRDLHWD
ncbi:hypothetical protein [Hydrogenophaga sp. PAMC20947]|uniref:hypothetical protein n=1 Tax=Hydrogenophaga sp. PAMC20947 TaxID=2565558 RepID=UPI00109DAFE8|nr:hypothetical protein [Hydrogenophaga sp. PAMC20947]QCB46834.1 hypothetical protein E5678_12870 [Hydrogenophaga sp. PAMC20947]